MIGETKMADFDDKTKRAAVKMLAAGETTVGEISYFLNLHRQTIAYWVRDIDVSERRFRMLERLWRQAARGG
jgi:hypothetical protein